MISQSRTTTAIDSLNYLENKKFQEFLASPYFNKESELCDLYFLLRYRSDSPAHLIDRNIPAGNPPVLESREDIHAILFPGATFDDQNIRRMLSVLLKLLLQFWSIENTRKDPLKMGLAMLPVLRAKDLEELYQYEFGKLRGTAAKNASPDSISILQNHLIETEYHQYLEDRKERSAVVNIEPAISTLDAFYLSHKLRYLCAAHNHNAILDSKIPTGLEEELITYLEKDVSEQQPATRLYYSIYKMLLKPSQEAHYQRVKENLAEVATGFEPQEAREVYAYAQNYCIRRINEGRSEFLEELFQLYNLLLEQSIILEKGIISPWDFKNIVTVALRLDAHAWTETFIDEYNPKIEMRFRENARTYNLARLAYHRKYYSRVLKLLSQVDYEDVFYALDSRVLLLKTYFELDETEPMYSLIDSFRVYLRRNKNISDRHRQTYLNLIKFTKKLSKIRPSEQSKLKSLKGDIEAAEQVADINWLREKIDKILVN